MSAVRMKLECISDISLNATLAEYNRQLLEQYDLLFIDTSYGREQGNIANTKNHLSQYLQGNLTNPSGVGFLRPKDFLGMALAGVEIEEYSIASDDNASVLRRQISDYMSTTLVGMVMEDIPFEVSSIFESGIMDRDVASERESNQAAIDGYELPMIENEEGILEQITLANPADAANGTRGSGVLNLVLDNTSDISSIKVDLSQYITRRAIKQGCGIPEEAAKISNGCNDILLMKYIFDKCGYYQNSLDKSLLKYQVEYMIKGNDTDWKNLEEVCKTLLLWREAANVMYIFLDGGKVSEAELLAGSLTAVTLCPELLEPVKISLLFAWAYVESLQDLKILLEGGKVPLIKNDETWHTHLMDILNVKGSLKHIDSQNGLAYKDYLAAMLMMEDSKKETFRLMDIIEMDVRKTPGNMYFKMDNCVDSIKAHISVCSTFGTQSDISRRYGYYYYR